MTSPAISVIIPAYNAERWIVRTLKSVQCQTFADLEIIVVIDGATDGTLAACRAAAVNDERIVIVETKNEGVAAARNAGLAIARGEFVAPIDADDLWHPSRLALHVNALRQRGELYGVAYSPNVMVDEHDLMGRVSRCYAADGYAFAVHLCANFVGNGSGITVRTTTLRDIGGYSSKLRELGAEGSEDYLAQLLLAYNSKIICVPSVVIGYRITPNNMSSNTVRMCESRLLTLQATRRAAPLFPRAVFLHPYAVAVLKLTWQYARNREWKRALALTWRESTSNVLVAIYLPFFAVSSISKQIAKRLGHALGSSSQTSIPFSAIEPERLRARQFPPITRVVMWVYNLIEQRIRHNVVKDRPLHAPASKIAGDHT